MEAEVARRWRGRFDETLRSAARVARRWAAGAGRRPHHLAAAALAAGLALAPNARAAVPVAALVAGAAALVAARAAGTPAWPRALLVSAMLCVGAVTGVWRVHAIDASAERAAP